MATVPSLMAWAAHKETLTPFEQTQVVQAPIAGGPKLPRLWYAHGGMVWAFPQGQPLSTRAKDLGAQVCGVGPQACLFSSQTRQDLVVLMARG